MSELSLDWETRSTVELKTAGVYRYAECSETDIWCAAWAFENEDPEIWIPGMSVPQRIVEHVLAGGAIRAFNAQFERIIWSRIAAPRYGWPVAALEQFYCTAAEAAAMALPRYLAGAAKVLGVEQQKDDAGARLMLRMAKPRKINTDGSIVWWDVPERKAKLYEYCKQDVRTERAIVPALRRLTPHEREIYLLDQRTNDRGVQVDLELVSAASKIVEIGVTRANARLDDLTDGAVPEVTQNRRLLQWLNANAVETDSIAKPTLAALLERDDLAANVEEVLQIRATVGRSSVAKLGSFQEATCLDGRARGLLLYHGASTGRWTGKLIQPHNFPRGEVDDIESLIPFVLDGEYDLLDLLHPPIVVVLSMLRSMLVASPGHDLIAADYSAIEARVLNWIAGQNDIVELFAKGEDVYKHNASRLYGIPLEEVLKFPHRQTGKFQELGCGYGMGWKKAVSAAKDTYGLEITEAQAKEIVAGYRMTHPQVQQFWYAIEAASIQAVLEPGSVFTVGEGALVKLTKRGGYLYVILPSGRPLCYAAPRVEQRMAPWGQMKDTLLFEGVNPKTRQWDLLSSYGGLLTENVVQAVSRDLMADGMLSLEANGYLPVLSVHDEVVAEVPVGFGSVGEFEQLLSARPAWATGCPVAAEGWRGFRYRK